MATGAAIVVMLVLLSGCGGSSSSSSTTHASQSSQSASQFKASIAPVLDQFKAASQKTGTALQHAGSQNDTQLKGTFQQVEAAWAAALTKLEALHPPARFTAAYNRLKGQVGKVKTDLAAIVSAAGSHDAAAAKAATTKLINDIVSAKATSRTLSSGTP